MELRRLRYFVVTAEELNFTRAAERLHIAQPSLSQQIQKLEAELKVQLLSRAGRHIQLTEAGKTFLIQARRLLAESANAVALVQRAAKGEVGQLSIGYNTTAEFQVFPQIIPAFRQKWPQVHLNFHNLGVTQQLDRLRAEELDLGFIWMLASDELDIRSLEDVSLVAVLPTGHRLASASQIHVRELSQEPLILFARSLDPQTYHQIEQIFSRAGAAMTVAYEVDNLLSMINFVAMGIGCSLMPDYARAIPRAGIVYKTVRGPNLVKTLAIAKKKGRQGLARIFFDFVLERHLVAATGKRNPDGVPGKRHGSGRKGVSR